MSRGYVYLELRRTLRYGAPGVRIDINIPKNRASCTTSSRSPINPRRACARVTVVVLCVCQCVQASHPLLTQLQDQVDIPMDSVSCSVQNEFGVFRRDR